MPREFQIVFDDPEKTKNLKELYVLCRHYAPHSHYVVDFVRYYSKDKVWLVAAIEMVVSNFGETPPWAAESDIIPAFVFAFLVICTTLSFLSWLINS